MVSKDSEHQRHEIEHFCLMKVTRAFLHYLSGVFEDPICAQVIKTNHALLLVGYGTDPKGGPYWLMKNSWGTQWGENGYVRMTQDSNKNCGVASVPIYVG